IAVAVTVPGIDILTYAVPDGVDAPPIGARVVVPLGARSVTGLVVERGAATGHPVDSIKPITDVLDRESFVRPDLIALARWTADYYACGVGDAIPSCCPRWREARPPTRTKRCAPRRSPRRARRR